MAVRLWHVRSGQRPVSRSQHGRSLLVVLLRQGPVNKRNLLDEVACSREGLRRRSEGTPSAGNVRAVNNVSRQTYRTVPNDEHNT